MQRRDFLRFAGLATSGLALPAASRAPSPNLPDRWRTFEVTTRVEVLNPAGKTRGVATDPLTVTAYQNPLAARSTPGSGRESAGRSRWGLGVWASGRRREAVSRS